MNAPTPSHALCGPSPRPASLLLATILVMIAILPLMTRAQTNTAPATATSRQPPSYDQVIAKIRDDCIQGRRTICGRILKVLPEGLVVESGYPSLMRPAVGRSWLLPGTIQAPREPNLVEAREPGGIGVGLVFLTDFPRSRSAKPKPYDYVVLEAYPAGNHTYTSVGTLQRTVRSFSANLQTAVTANCAAAGITAPTL